MSNLERMGCGRSRWSRAYAGLPLFRSRPIGDRVTRVVNANDQANHLIIQATRPTPMPIHWKAWRQNPNHTGNAGIASDLPTLAVAG